MITLMNKRAKNKKGFTLIELLVVLAILAIIALIAVPNFIGVRDQAIADADAQTTALVKKAMELMVVAENVKYDSTSTNNNNLCTVSTDGIKAPTSNAAIGDNGAITDIILKKYVDITKKYQGTTTAKTFTIIDGGGVE